MANSKQWFGGTLLLAAVLERFAKDQDVVVTRQELEALDLKTTHPVVFTLSDDGESVSMRVERPAIEQEQ